MSTAGLTQIVAASRTNLEALKAFSTKTAGKLLLSASDLLGWQISQPSPPTLHLPAVTVSQLTWPPPALAQTKLTRQLVA